MAVFCDAELSTVRRRGLFLDVLQAEKFIQRVQCDGDDFLTAVLCSSRVAWVQADHNARCLFPLAQFRGETVPTSDDLYPISEATVTLSKLSLLSFCPDCMQVFHVGLQEILSTSKCSDNVFPRSKQSWTKRDDKPTELKIFQAQWNLPRTGTRSVFFLSIFQVTLGLCISASTFQESKSYSTMEQSGFQMQNMQAG